MKYQQKALILLAALIISGCVGHRGKAEVELFYWKQKTSVVDVFNISDPWVSSEPIEYLLQRDQQYGEFGGRLGLCSNDEFFCVKGGVAAAIPRSITKDHEPWEFEGVRCRVIDMEDDMFTIECARDEKNPLTSKTDQVSRFNYSVRHGILSFTHLDVMGTPTYRLLGDDGLFSPIFSDSTNDWRGSEK